MDEKEIKYIAKLVNEATESFLRFWGEIQQSEMLISYLQVSNELVGSNKDEAKKYFTGIYNHSQNPNAAKETLQKKMDQFLDIKYYENPLSSMVYVRTIDNFITYFKEILAEIVQVKPQILKSQESEKLDFILDYESMDDLINAIATKKIEELFYKGIEDIEKFFKTRLGIDIFKNSEEKDTINQLIKQRNLTVHNRRKISKEFSKQFPILKYEVGQYLTFEFQYVSTINLHLYNFIAQIDEELSEKFKLKKISSLE
jgi:hypothetical protein